MLNALNLFNLFNGIPLGVRDVPVLHGGAGSTASATSWRDCGDGPPARRRRASGRRGGALVARVPLFCAFVARRGGPGKR